MADKKIVADLHLCQGYGNCVAYADRYFDLNDEGIVVVLSDHVPEEDAAEVADAVMSCPVNALRVVDE